ncbi:odorant receptor Or2-like isoform X2 [Cylas formicarius]|uniref:odorant receptor Or2-like isoform X2 n=1 Tax=Cylas formicarius TaxID=197179 RepID=UPI002958341C|nr:odorant receptor Or2-like isoform X2 [Cylas formicarius]
MELKPILKLAANSMILAGTWPLPLPTKNVALRKTYAVYCRLIHIFFSIFLLSLYIQFGLKVNDGNSDENREGLFSQMSFLISLLIVGVTIILYRRKNARLVIKYIMKADANIARSKDEDVLRYHSRQIQFCRRLSFGIVSLSVWMGISMFLETHLQRLEIENFNKGNNRSIEKPLTFDMYFFNLDRAKYETTLLCISYVLLPLNCLLFTSSKIIFFSCIIFPASVLKTLQIRFRKLGVAGSDMLANLKELIAEHQQTIWFIQKLNDSVKYLIFLDFLLNSLDIATVSIQLITLEKNKLASPMIFFGLLIVQTFVLGWSANEIKTQSLALGDSLYESSWYEQSEVVKKMILTVLIRMQRPLVLTIGPFDAMTTESALAIMKGSYTYISVMLNTY